MDFVKIKIKDAALTLFCNFNANLSHSLSDDTYWDFSKNTNLEIQKSYKGNRVVTIDKDIYVKHIELIFKGKIDTKKGLLNFNVNYEKQISEYLKSLKSSEALSIEQHQKIKAVCWRPGILYGLCKIQKT